MNKKKVSLESCPGSRPCPQQKKIPPIFYLFTRLLRDNLANSWPRGEHDDKRVRYSPQGAIVSGICVLSLAKDSDGGRGRGGLVCVCGRAAQKPVDQRVQRPVVQHAGLPGSLAGLAIYSSQGDFAGQRPHGMGPTELVCPPSDGSRMRFQELSRFSTRASCSGSQSGGRFLARECIGERVCQNTWASWSGDSDGWGGGESCRRLRHMWPLVCLSLCELRLAPTAKTAQ